MNITKSSEKIVGGVASLRYILVSEVKSFPTIMKYRAVNFEEVVLKNNVEWKTIYFTPETCFAGSESKNDDAGTFYTNTITFQHPGENEDTSLALETLKETPMIAIVKNLNGVEKLFGTPDNPMRLYYDQNTDDAVMKSTGYKITISGAGIYPAFLLKES